MVDFYTYHYPRRAQLLNNIAYDDLTDYNSRRFNAAGSFLYGPVLSLKLSEKWSVSSVFTASVPYRQFAHSREFHTYGMYVNNQRLRVKKYDSDTTISYSILPYLKIFSGFKYQGYSYVGRFKYYNKDYSSTPGLDLITWNFKGDSDGYGTGLGMGTTLALTESLYLLGNVSGIYLNTRTYRRETIVDFGRIYEFQYFNSLGFSGSLSLAYYIPAASVTISLGGRFQMLKYYCSRITQNQVANLYLQWKIFDEKVDSLVKKMTYDGTRDYLYGATLSVTYNFKI